MQFKRAELGAEGVVSAFLLLSINKRSRSFTTTSFILDKNLAPSLLSFLSSFRSSPVSLLFTW